MQLAGDPEQLALHRPLQLPLHSAWHVPIQSAPASVVAHCPMHELEQSPSQVPEQSALQLKLPGLQLAIQLPSQLTWQLGSVALQPPLHIPSNSAEHASSRLESEHWTSQEALAITVHDSLPLNTAPPQSDRMSARADPAASVTTAPATKARREDQRNMRNLLKNNYP